MKHISFPLQEVQQGHPWDFKKVHSIDLHLQLQHKFHFGSIFLTKTLREVDAYQMQKYLLIIFYESVPLSIDLHKMVSKLICLLKMTVFTTEMHSQLFLRRNVFLAKKCLTVIRMVKQGVDGGIIDKTFIQEHSWMKVLFILLFYNSVQYVYLLKQFFTCCLVSFSGAVLLGIDSKILIRFERQIRVKIHQFPVVSLLGVFPLWGINPAPSNI